MGACGRAPSGVRGRGLAPEAERHSLFRRHKEGKIWPIVKGFSVVLKWVHRPTEQVFLLVGTLT